MAEQRTGVTEVLEEGLDDKDSRLSWLGEPIWFGGEKKDGVGKRILGELEKYWMLLAQQGRTLEEAAK